MTSAARADVAGAMDGYFNDMGAAANVTGPSAFQSQSAGYYSAGNIWTRFPQKNVNLANLQLPSVKAGCGGIDLFAGSFSFINSAQLIALLKSIANNAVGFAFKLAIDTVCPECSKVMEEMKQAAQLMNNQSINSWPDGGGAGRLGVAQVRHGRQGDLPAVRQFDGCVLRHGRVDGGLR